MKEKKEALCELCKKEKQFIYWRKKNVCYSCLYANEKKLKIEDYAYIGVNRLTTPVDN